MLKRVCDKCGRVVESPAEMMVEHTSVKCMKIQYYWNLGDMNVRGEMCLCNKCAELLNKWFREPPKEET